MRWPVGNPSIFRVGVMPLLYAELYLINIYSSIISCKNDNRKKKWHVNIKSYYGQQIGCVS